ncbi:hypothetical protein ABAC460_00600 [Asticcacaulis sp. AC460]|uniref:c-type cytochrome n=1 Tax=Asticcacaulis sp. AC460 TaxID=1282360 RepID=UPI0003C3B073|nr:c-type cytochrome [Asticcacaulis sp. AC460]ESQ93601.1 hypothetical protein ABAC460_00600 [Asticcacaulis sp. AC460]
MRVYLSCMAVAVILASCTPKPQAVESAPDWAYPMKPAATAPEPVDTALHHVPDSAAAFHKAELKSLASAPDWHPDEHPAMPEVVVHGSGNGAGACAYCHLPNGAGRPENAPLAGLPKAYIIAQVRAFGDASRTSSVHRAPADNMAKVAKAAQPGDDEAAAAYFAALTPRSFVRVVETDTVPKTEPAAWILRLSAGAGTEPIGNRIIEVPDDFARFELRDSRTAYTAYVPAGSIARGRALVAGKAGKVGCVSCHGTDLTGTGDIPGIAGRFPTYIIRQLYDFKSGARADIASAAMKPVADRLSAGDRIDIAAYLATLRPASGA